MPAGLLVTAPLPLPILLTVRAGSVVTVNETELLVPPEVVTDIGRPPGVALGVMVRVAIADVALDGLMLLAVTPFPTLTVKPSPNTFPVSVTWRLEP
jgi:hypothetical protein